MFLAVDPGTTQSACALMDDKYRLLACDKVNNADILDIIRYTPNVGAVVIEDMEPRYQAGKTSTAAGAVVGMTTYTTLKWMGKFALTAEQCGIPVAWIYRRDERKTLVPNKKNKLPPLPEDAPKHADGQIRAALVARFAQHDKKNGRGTKANRDVFYGVSGDMWQAIAVGVTWLDMTQKARR